MHGYSIIRAGGLIAATITAGVLLTAAGGQEPAEKRPLLRHVVLFKFKQATSQDQLKQIENAFRALPGKIDTIVDFEWGTDVSVEDKAKGFTHCFLVSFADEAGRKTYLPHPAHQEFVQLVGPHLDDVLVVDYWAGK